VVDEGLLSTLFANINHCLNLLNLILDFVFHLIVVINARLELLAKVVSLRWQDEALGVHTLHSLSFHLLDFVLSFFEVVDQIVSYVVWHFLFDIF